MWVQATKGLVSIRQIITVRGAVVGPAESTSTAVLYDRQHDGVGVCVIQLFDGNGDLGTPVGATQSWLGLVKAGRDRDVPDRDVDVGREPHETLWGPCLVVREL